jgi:antitoxin (DNA-binding transcriptional repressor) of toxin-antitoxin stability system
MLKMHHMQKASVRDLRYSFKKIERILRQGEEVQITKRRRVIARLVPENPERAPKPDLLSRLHSIYGDKVLAVGRCRFDLSRSGTPLKVYVDPSVVVSLYSADANSIAATRLIQSVTGELFTPLSANSRLSTPNASWPGFFTSL